MDFGYLLNVIHKHAWKNTESFKDYVKTASIVWDLFPPSWKKWWKDLAEEFRKTNEGKSLVEVHSDMKKAEDPLWQKIYYHLYHIQLLFLIRMIEVQYFAQFDA